MTKNCKVAMETNGVPLSTLLEVIAESILNFNLGPQLHKLHSLSVEPVGSPKDLCALIIIDEGEYTYTITQHVYEQLLRTYIELGNKADHFDALYHIHETSTDE